MPKPRLSRRKLLVGAAPLVAAPALGKLALAGGTAEAAEHTGHTGHEGHMLSHAAMVGDAAPGGRRAERPRRPSLPAARHPAQPWTRARVHPCG